MLTEIAIALTLLVFILVLWAIARMSNLGKSLENLKSKIDLLSTPSDTINQIIAALQNNVGLMSSSISDMQKSIGSIDTHATKIETLGKKYEETENLTRSIHNIMIGSYEKGRSGENFLRNMMNELIKIGFVQQNVSIGSNVVEYCVEFNDGKLLAIDSKVVATQDIDKLFDEETSDADRKRASKKIKTALVKKIEEVCKYIDPQRTLPCAIMAVPDSLLDISSEVISIAVKKNVMIAGYSAVPQLIVYFHRIHGYYSIEEDVAELNSRIATIRQELSKLDDKFFASRVDRPLTMFNNAILILRQSIAKISGIINIEQKTLSTIQNENGEE